jgi:hypothetical protein
MAGQVKKFHWRGQPGSMWRTAGAPACLAAFFAERVPEIFINKINALATLVPMSMTDNGSSRHILA